MNNEHFTEKQHEDIYQFLDRYVRPDRKVEARRVLKSMFKYDRSLLKSKIHKGIMDVLHSHL